LSLKVRANEQTLLHGRGQAARPCFDRGGAFQAPCPRSFIDFSHHLEIIYWAMPIRLGL